MKSLTKHNVERPKGSNSKFSVGVDTGTQNPLKLRLFEVWLTLWCQRHCHNLWDIKPAQSKSYQFVMEFADSKEAVLFKLASSSMITPQPIEKLSFIAVA